MNSLLIINLHSGNIMDKITYDGAPSTAIRKWADALVVEGERYFIRYLNDHTEIHLFIMRNGEEIETGRWAAYQI